MISNPVIAEDFRYMIKHYCGMLAKGWIMGAQFEAILEDDRYFRLAKHADDMAEKLRSTLRELGYSFLADSCINILFPVLPDALLEQLKENFTFTEQERVDSTHRAVRFCTSWATKESDVDALCAELKRLTI